MDLRVRAIPDQVLQGVAGSGRAFCPANEDSQPWRGFARFIEMYRDAAKCSEIRAGSIQM